MDMSLDNNEFNKKLIEDSVKSQEKLSIVNLLCTTLICSGPTGCLILRILDNETDKLLLTALCAIPTLIYMTWSWFSFFYNRKIDKELKELEELVDKYERKIYKGK